MNYTRAGHLYVQYLIWFDIYSVSDPSHYRYGQYLTAAQVDDLLRPSEETFRFVEEWLQDHGIQRTHLKLSSPQGLVSLTLPIKVAESLLRTNYSVFQHKEDNTLVIRAPEWSLPQHLHAHIDYVQPTSSFFLASNSKRADSNASGDQALGSLNQLGEPFPDDPARFLDLNSLSADLSVSQACNASAITPLCLRTLYGTLDYVTKASDHNRMALTNYLGEFNNRSDIDIFLRSYRPDAAFAGAAYNFTAEDFAGAINQQTPATSAQLERGAGREGNLDAQIMLGIGFPTPLVTYSTGSIPPPFIPDAFTPNNTNEPFLTWLMAVLAQDDLPQVISTSYGDIEHTIPPSYANRVCQGFAQLGARGVTVIFGAGDSGVGRSGKCFSNEKGREHQPEFLSVFPESCPYGTSVGATRNLDPEIVAYNPENGFVSGGGFSRYFPRPAYQDSVVGSYLSKLGTKHAGLYNPSGRTYPDVAVQGYRYATVWNGTTYLVDGTSAAAPTFATIIALVNDALLADEKPPLGFMNPWLYKEGWKAFRDVTVGSNRGCNTSGFPALEGWDAASGWGTPVGYLFCGTGRIN